jgi:hypothetical protein
MVDLRQYLPKVAHVDARSAYRAVAEMVGLGAGDASPSPPCCEEVLARTMDAG